MAKKITVTRKEAVELLTDLGFKDIRKADNATMERRLGKMKLYLDSFEGTMNGEMKTLSKKCIKAGKDNITVKGDEPKAGKSKSKSKSESKSKSKSKSKSESKSKGKNKADTDSFGSRIGSGAATVNKMLSKRKAIPMKVFIEATGNSHYDHLKRLIGKGLVRKTKKGYILT